MNPARPACSLCRASDGLTSTDPTICFVCKRLRESVKIEMRELREAYGES